MKLKVILLTIMMVVALAGPAAAHSSTYCGHGSAGWMDRVVFIRSWDNGSTFTHSHAYYHYRWHWRGYYFVHTEVKRCPAHIQRW